MGKAPTHVVSAGDGSIRDQIVDTVLAPQTPTGTQALGDGTNPVTINYYNMQAADAALARQLVADYDAAAPANQDAFLHNDFTSPPITAQDFSWNTEQREFLESLENITENLSFNQIGTYNPATVDMVFAETAIRPGTPAIPATATTPAIPATPAVTDAFLGGDLGVAIFPGTLPATSPHVTHTTVNGHDPMFANVTSEASVGNPRHSNLGHEVGHSTGQSHPHAERGILNAAGNLVPNPAFVTGVNGNGDMSINGNFPPGFALNNNKYTMMSYQWATNTGTNPIANPTQYGQNMGPMAIDVAAQQRLYGIKDHNTGDTTYNLVDGAQIGAGSNNPAAEVSQAFVNGVSNGGLVVGADAAGQEYAAQEAAGYGTERMLGRGYRTIYDGEKDTETVPDTSPGAAAGATVTREVVGNAGDADTISYDGAQQSAFINLNDAGMGGDETNRQYLDLIDDVKASTRWGQLNVTQRDPATGAEIMDASGNPIVVDARLQNDLDATIHSPLDSTGSPILRSDGYSAGGSFSRLYKTDANGRVTAVQDGGYSIAPGVIIENASGGAAADTILGNEHSNELRGNGGDDVMFGGHGNDTLIGGIGSDILHGGHGIDTASYADHFSPLVGPIAIPETGFAFEINGANATATNLNTPIPMIPEVDTLIDIENIVGSSRNDTFTVENVSGNMYIDGGAGTNTLTVSGAASGYTLDMNDGTYPVGHPRAGEAYGGKLTSPDGSDIIYYDNIDETNITGLTPVTPAPAASGSRAETALPELGDTLQAAMLAERARMASEAAERPLSAEDAQYAELLDSADIPVVMNTLNDNGVASLDVTGPMSTPQEQVSSITEAASAKMQAEDIPYPQAEIDAAHAARDAEQAASKDTYQRDLDRGADDDVGIAFG